MLCASFPLFLSNNITMQTLVGAVVLYKRICVSIDKNGGIIGASKKYSLLNIYVIN
jgi:hypothetical protein